MKGFMKASLAVACLAGTVGCMGGERYRNLIDPCQMERYGAQARQEVISSFAPQVQNGRILDQTIWNWQFEAGTDKLNPSGMFKLDSLVRRRPEPDPRIFIATARDIGYDTEKPDAYGEARRDLDSKRAEAIQKYMAAQTAGRPMTFDILIHDPKDPGMPGISARAGWASQIGNYSGQLGTTGGGAAQNALGGGGGGGQGTQQNGSSAGAGAGSSTGGGSGGGTGGGTGSP